MKIAAVGDIHTRSTDSGRFQNMFETLSHEADVLLLCGDLTHEGTTKEADVLRNELKACTIPVIAVFGNHDYEGAVQEQIREILEQNPKVTVLEGDTITIESVGFAGIKGFQGGFGAHHMPFWGEPVAKAFVRETVESTLALERALQQLKTDRIVVVMHYSPLWETVSGEHPEIIPFLGSSKFADVINRFPVQYVFHGHAHHGHPHALTSKGIPVFNVAQPLLQAQTPSLSYLIQEI